ncbi:hypothetical protein B0H12DRAFT_150549 [Mycena haematopus]|nr:hypothetical protein B0H12DRAFT_150549 [Mycena haematopus]
MLAPRSTQPDLRARARPRPLGDTAELFAHVERREKRIGVGLGKGEVPDSFCTWFSGVMRVDVHHQLREDPKDDIEEAGCIISTGRGIVHAPYEPDLDGLSKRCRSANEGRKVGRNTRCQSTSHHESAGEASGGGAAANASCRR